MEPGGSVSVWTELSENGAYPHKAQVQIAPTSARTVKRLRRQTLDCWAMA